MNLEGDLGDVSLASLIQLMGTRRRSGAIILRQSGQTGRVYFVGGEIVDAAAGATRGEEAVYQLLAWDSASFQVRGEIRPPGRSIWASWNQLLLDGMQKIDEGKHQDETEDHLVALLSALEQIKVRLGEKKVRRKPKEVLVLCGELVNRAADFWTDLPERDGVKADLAALLADLARRKPAARLLEARGRRLPPASFEHIYRTLPKGNAEISFEAVSSALLDLLERLLTLIVERFRSVDLREQWSETCSLFVQEVRATVEPARGLSAPGGTK